MSAGVVLERSGSRTRAGARALVALFVGAAVLLAGIGALPSGVAPSAAQAACDTSSVLRNNASSVDAIEAGAQRNFFDRLNALRRSKGLGSLTWNQAMTDPAIAWSRTMSTQVPPGGSSSDPGWLHHARDTGSGDGVEPWQDYVTINSKIVSNWQRLAENVGVGGMRSSCSLSELDTNTDRVVSALHDAFVASSGHYKNMVGDHNQVGIGVHIDPDELWVTVRFAKGDLPRTSVASSTVSSSTAAFLDRAYKVFAGRTATDGEKRFWAPAVNAGNRYVVTHSLAVSDSWSGVRVNDLYQVVFGRSADSAGRAYWLNMIANGLRLEAVAAEFYGSPEYLYRNGGTNRSFVSALYRDLMGRSADSAGLNYWLDHLRTGRLTRVGVADNFYASIESRRDRSARLHRQILGSYPSGVSHDWWAARLAHVGDVGLAAELGASSAFWNLAVG